MNRWNNEAMPAIGIIQDELRANLDMKELSMKTLQFPMVAIICLFTTFYLPPLHAQDAGNLQEKETTDTTDISAAESELVWYETKALFPTRIVYPPEFDTSRAHTLIIGLHGLAGTMDNLQESAEVLTADGFIVALPQAVYPTHNHQGKLGYDWTLWRRRDSATSIRAAELVFSDQLPSVVADLQQRYQIDHVYLLGSSQGAIIAMITAINSGDLFDGVVSFFPAAFDISWFTEDALEASRGVRVMLLHGRDDQIARFSVSEKAGDALKEAGYDVTFRPFDGGHRVPIDQLDFVTEWIKK
jgi:predicted esterase